MGTGSRPLQMQNQQDGEHQTSVLSGSSGLKFLPLSSKMGICNNYLETIKEGRETHMYTWLFIIILYLGDFCCHFQVALVFILSSVCSGTDNLLKKMSENFLFPLLETQLIRFMPPFCLPALSSSFSTMCSRSMYQSVWGHQRHPHQGVASRCFPAPCISGELFQQGSAEGADRMGVNILSPHQLQRATGGRPQPPHLSSSSLALSFQVGSEILGTSLPLLPLPPWVQR